MNYHFPFLPLNHAITVRRVGIALLFFAHAAIRLLNGTIPRFGEFQGQRGFPFGEAWILGITVFELVGGILVTVGYQTRAMGAGFFTIALVGMVPIHRKFGWFVGEQCTGDCEYRVALMLALAVIAAAAGSEQDQILSVRKKAFC